MWPFKAVYKDLEEEDLVLVEEEEPTPEEIPQDLLIAKVLKEIKQDQDGCPELMKATNSCFCISCSQVGKCHVEKMIKATKCTHFSTYCSKRMAEKGKCEWADIALQEFAKHLRQRFNVDDRPVDKELLDKFDREVHDAKEKERRTRIRLSTGCSDDIEECVHEDGDKRDD